MEMGDRQVGCSANWLSRHVMACKDDIDGVKDQSAKQNGDGECQEATIIVDCRPTESYKTAHIGGAVSLSLPTLMTRRLARRQLAARSVIGVIEQQQQRSQRQRLTADVWKHRTVVFYDDSTSVTALSEDLTASNSCLVMMLAQRFNDDGYHAMILEGGFEQFRQKYPNLCSTHDANDDDSDAAQYTPPCVEISRLSLHSTGDRDDGAGQVAEEERSSLRELIISSPPTLVAPYLYIGNAQNALDIDCLRTNGIRYIVNVTNNVPNRFEDDSSFRYMKIPIRDHWSQSLTAYLPSAISFIDEARRVESGVMVHCLAGISRSVTVTVAYLMSSMSLSLDDAYELVKRRRPHASPSLNFMGQLLDFESSLPRRRTDHDCTDTNDGSPSTSNE